MNCQTNMSHYSRPTISSSCVLEKPGVSSFSLLPLLSSLAPLAPLLFSISVFPVFALHPSFSFPPSLPFNLHPVLFSPVDIDAQVQWLPNGSVVVRWSLPASLRSHASLEIRIGGGRWEPISSGAHLLAELDPSRPHDIELRVNSAQWQVRGQGSAGGRGRERGRERGNGYSG